MGNTSLTCVNSEQPRQEVLSPYRQVRFPVCTNTEIITTKGTATARATIKRKEGLLVTSAIVKLEKSYTAIEVIKPHD